MFPFIIVIGQSARFQEMNREQQLQLCVKYIFKFFFDNKMNHISVTKFHPVNNKLMKYL